MANTFIFDDDEQPDMGGGGAPEQDDDQTPEEGEGGNRMFTIIMIVLGVLFVLAILCVGGFFFINRNNAAQQNSLAVTNDFATQQIIASQTQLALQASPTLEPTQAFTETATTTPVVVVFASETPNGSEPTLDPALATAAVLQTQLAQTQQVLATTTGTRAADAGKGTPTKVGGTGAGGVATATNNIPQTGFAEEVGLPALGILTIVLLAVIFLARRLRAAPGR